MAPLAGEAQDYVGEHLFALGVDVACARHEYHFFLVGMAGVRVDEFDECPGLAVRESSNWAKAPSG